MAGAGQELEIVKAASSSFSLIGVDAAVHCGLARAEELPRLLDALAEAKYAGIALFRGNWAIPARR